MVECSECKKIYECLYGGELVGRLTSCPDFQQKPKTNADRIRAMTDRELADFLADRFARKELFGLISDTSAVTATQISAIKKTWYTVWMQWLQQPAEE